MPSYSFETSATNALKGLQEKTIEGQKLFVARWKPRQELKKLWVSKVLIKKRHQMPNQKFYDENMRPDHMNNFAFKPGVKNLRTLPLIPVNPNHMPQVSANNILRIPNQAIKGRPGNKETNVSYSIKIWLWRC